MSYCQDTIVNRFCLGLNIGVTNTKISDRYLNSQIYNNTSVNPWALNFWYLSEDFFHHIKFDKKAFKLKNDVDFYEQNYIDYWNYSLQYDFAYSFFKHRDFLRLLAGVSYKGQVSNYDQHYKNSLYYYANGVKESYDSSISTVFLGAGGILNFRGHSLYANYSYSIVNYGSRPGFDLLNGSDWFLLSLKEFQSYQAFVEYKKILNHHISFNVQFNIELYKYSNHYELKKIESQFLVGLNYEF